MAGMNSVTSGHRSLIHKAQMFNKNEASKLNGLETSDLGTNMNKLYILSITNSQSASISHFADDIPCLSKVVGES